MRKKVAADIIERCDNPWAPPLVPVKKPDGSIRLCEGYQRLNEVTVKEPYCTPDLEMLELVVKKCVLSKVNLTKGFH